MKIFMIISYIAERGNFSHHTSVFLAVAILKILKLIDEEHRK